MNNRTHQTSVVKVLLILFLGFFQASADTPMSQMKSNNDQVTPIRLIAIPSTVVFSHTPSAADVERMGIEVTLTEDECHKIIELLKNMRFKTIGPPNRDCRVLLIEHSNGKRRSILIDKRYLSFIVDGSLVGYSSKTGKKLSFLIKSIVSKNSNFINEAYDKKAFPAN